MKCSLLYENIYIFGLKKKQCLEIYIHIYREMEKSERHVKMQKKINENKNTHAKILQNRNNTQKFSEFIGIKIVKIENWKLRKN